MSLEHSELDRQQVEAQLGRPLRGRWGVAARCHLGIPMVIENHPKLEDGSPFPTLYWLTCPLLIKRTSMLESAGWMQELTVELERSDTLRARFAASIDRYRARRDEHERIEDSGSTPGGGPDRVKCLHAHLAHQLAGGENPVGSRTLTATGWPDCVRPCIAAEGEP